MTSWGGLRAQGSGALAGLRLGAEDKRDAALGVELDRLIEEFGSASARAGSGRPREFPDSAIRPRQLGPVQSVRSAQWYHPAPVDSLRFHSMSRSVEWTPYRDGPPV